MGHGFIVFLGYLGSFPGAWERGYRILHWRVWQPCHPRMIHGWATDSLYSWDTLLEGLATLPSMDGPWVHCIPGILYRRAWQPCHQWMIHGWAMDSLYSWDTLLEGLATMPSMDDPWMGHGFIVFLGYFTGGPGNHAINGWPVDGPWIHCIPGILYWRAWQPCHQWTIHGWAIVFLGYFTGGPGYYAIHG